MIGPILAIYFCGMPLFLIPALQNGDEAKEKTAILLAWPIFLLILIGRGLWQIARRP